jgi:phospholipase/carboxylesterase
MHGLGADGNDFVPIVRELDLSECPAIRFVFPHAETMPVTINNGYVMRAWYDILGMDLVRREDEVGLRKSQGQVEQLIAREIERGISADRIIRHDSANRPALSKKARWLAMSFWLSPVS